MEPAKQKNSIILNTTLWVAQLFLALIFVWAGIMKLFQPGELSWPWVREHPDLVTISGVFDLLAGAGLVLPVLLRVFPKLTIFAAYGSIALMLSAAAFHVSRGEVQQIWFNIFVLAVAVFIAWGWSKKLK